MSKTEPWWKSAVLYQIYPRSFADSTGSGTGDLAGITARLSYLADLGIDAIWISPFFLSPMKDFGYDVEDHRQVDPLFGSNEGFGCLARTSPFLGIRVLIDLVLSHCSENHPWFQDCLKGRKPHDEAFIWDPGPDGEPPNNWISIFGGPAWTFHEGRGQYYLHNFLVSQPDLNYHSPKVRDRKPCPLLGTGWTKGWMVSVSMRSISASTTSELRDNPMAQTPDGQSVQLSNPYGTLLHVYDKNHPVPQFLEELRAVMDEYEDRVTLGEIGASRDVSQALMGEYTAPGRLNLCYSFDFLTPSFDAGHFRDLIARLGVADSNFWGCCLFQSRCDAGGVSSGGQSAPPEAIARISMALLPTCSGGPRACTRERNWDWRRQMSPSSSWSTPMALHSIRNSRGRDGCRTPMPWTGDSNGGFCPEDATPWLPIPDHHRSNAVSRALEDPSHVIHSVRALLQFRKQHPALATGDLNLLPLDSRLLAFERVTDEARLECVFNLSSETVEVPESAD